MIYYSIVGHISLLKRFNIALLFYVMKIYKMLKPKSRIIYTNFSNICNERSRFLFLCLIYFKILFFSFRKFEDNLWEKRYRPVSFLFPLPFPASWFRFLIRLYIFWFFVSDSLFLIRIFDSLFLFMHFLILCFWFAVSDSHLWLFVYAFVKSEYFKDFVIPITTMLIKVEIWKYIPFSIK